MTNSAKVTFKSPTTSMRSLAAGALTVAMLAAGLSFAAPTPAAAQVCAHLGNGVAICFGGNGGRPNGEYPVRPVPVRQPGVNRMLQVIRVKSLYGNSSIVQSFKPNVLRSRAITRICMANYSNHRRSFAHGVPHINNLTSLGGGRESCANFPSNWRVHFTLVDGNSIARPSRPMVMSLSAFAGGLVRFTWQ